MQESNEPECMINSSDKSKEAQKHVKRNKECGDNEHNDHRVMNKGQDALVSMKHSGQDATLLGIPSKKQCAVQITAQVPISEETKKEGSEGPKTRNKEVRVKKSRIRETKNLSTDADSRTDTILESLIIFNVLQYLHKLQATYA